jgi:hypothetical protein
MGNRRFFIANGNGVEDNDLRSLIQDSEALIMIDDPELTMLKCL